MKDVKKNHYEQSLYGLLPDRCPNDRGDPTVSAHKNQARLQNSKTMRFDNSARMQQLDCILKPKKSSSRCKAGSRSRSGKGDNGSRASSASSGDVLSEVSGDRSATAYNTLSNSSHHSAVSRTRHSQSRSVHSVNSRAPGCKQVVRLQESWRRLKAMQASEQDIGKNIMSRVMGEVNPSFDRTKDLEVLIVETIDSIVSQAGPSLFDEDFENLRLTWVEKGLDSCQVAGVLLDGLSDSAEKDIFSENTVRAWQTTVVELLSEWGSSQE